MIARVRVDVALSRPPRAHDSVMVLVNADTDNEAHLVASQLAACDPRVIMPVGSEIVELLEF